MHLTFLLDMERKVIRTGGKELKSPEEVREHVLSLPRRERYYFLEKYNTMLDKVSEKVMDIREDIIEQIEVGGTCYAARIPESLAAYH